MNSPYMGYFKVTQTQHETHDGLDLVGLDSKNIHSTVDGTVIYAGWENDNDHSQGFGQFVCIYSPVHMLYFYFGHLSEIKVKKGQTVKVTDIIGVEGNTGYSTGSHCHYCARRDFEVGNAVDISSISGIPNKLGTYDDGFRENGINTTMIDTLKKMRQEMLNILNSLENLIDRM